MNLRFVWALAFLLLFWSKSFAQEVNPRVVPVTVFYDKYWRIITKHDASFMRVAHLDTVKFAFRGKVTDFYANGAPLLQVNYLETGKDGSFQLNYSNKQVEQRGIFLQNRPVGKWEYFYQTGIPHQTIEFLEDNFKVVSFYDVNGQQLVKDGTGNWYGSMRANVNGVDMVVWVTGTWHNGLRTGIWKGNQLNGKPVFEEEFEAGILKKGKVYDHTGKKMKGTYTEQENPKLASLDFLLHTEGFHVSPMFSTRRRALDYILKKEHLLPPATDGAFQADKVTQMPEFPGGQAAMFLFLQKNFRVPKDAMKNKVNGTVILTMVIDSTGQVKDVDIKRALYPSIDQEALRVVKIMPRWKPGLLDGKPVSVKYTIPYRISFK